ncbi:IclR family transcriptional regulator [Gordonia sinesedis]
MQKRVIERPSYTITSVDNALRLLEMLRDVGAVRLSDAAAELGVANSTAHRLLAMLAYRGFAVQDEHRRYHPGPAMGAGPARHGWTRTFTDRARPHMVALTALTGETTNLIIRVGTQIRFLASTESSTVLRIGDRQGQILDAHRTAGGRVLLAELDDAVLAQLYRRPDQADTDPGPGPRLSPAEFDELRTMLRGDLEAGAAINREMTEYGVAAFGVAIHNGRHIAIGSLTVTVPTGRYDLHARGPLLGQLRRCVRDIEHDVADIDP